MAMAAEGQTQVSGPPTWHPIHRYAYVTRPFEDVWTAVAGSPSMLLDESTGEGVKRLELRARLAGVHLARPVLVRVGGLVNRGDRAFLALAWWDQGQRNLFPVMEAVLELVPVDYRGWPITQIGLVGRYRPPFGAFGNAIDRVAGAQIVAESVTWFVEEVARRLAAALPAQEALEPPLGKETAPVDLEPWPHVFLPVDGLSHRVGGAAAARQRLASIPGVQHVEIDPIAAMAVVDYDPERCTPDDFVAVLDADADADTASVSPA
jgi:copper chaperone CopZ